MQQFFCKFANFIVTKVFLLYEFFPLVIAFLSKYNLGLFKSKTQIHSANLAKFFANRFAYQFHVFCINYRYTALIFQFSLIFITMT